jgi:UDP-N-acetylmuramoyl-L-alanyl-D-glutamate--2,6-diaminopimelate ligase
VILSSPAGILESLAARGISVAGLCADSRRLQPGEVFVAYPGAQADGRRFIAQAVERGAAAVLWDKQGFDLGAPLPVPDIPVEGLHGLCGPLADLVYGRPSQALWMVGVTGTNGKTTVSQWIAQCLEMLGRRCAVIGTLGSGFPGALTESLNTTPDAIDLHRDLAAYRACGAQAAAMEVSSIGLDQGRVEGVAFDVATFTNFTRDHLEYHRTMEAYGAAKARLFESADLGHAVLNLDDEFGHNMARRLRATAIQRVGYTLRPEAYSPNADVVFGARHIAVTSSGLSFSAVTPEGEFPVEAPLVGRFNIANLLAVLASLWASGFRPAETLPLLGRLAPPQGRMQRLGGADEPLVVVDYAHTPDALEQALLALRETAEARAGRLLCVFGCGGDRDRGKRPQMGQVAARLADLVIITADNPRSEDPGAIINDIVSGTGDAAEIELDRAAAIARAVSEAGPRDVVIIAGKGHEDYQEIAGRRFPFSDVDHAAHALARRRGAPS